MTARTLTVRGHKIRSQSMRRFIIVVIYKTDSGERAEIHTRSDNLAKLRKLVANWRPGRTLVIVDTTTGEEVSA